MYDEYTSVISHRTAAKLVEFGATLERGPDYHDLRGILDGLSSLSASSVVRASAEIQAAAFRNKTLRRSNLFLFLPFRKIFSVADLLRLNPSYAWLFLFHHNGHVRQAALETIKDAPPSPFLLAALALRLNDWVVEVRQAAMDCAHRVLPVIDPSVVVDAAVYILDRRFSWTRWGDEHRVLDDVLERREVLSKLADFLCTATTGPVGVCLRFALRFPAMDTYLPRLASDAIQPAVRAVAYRAMISGRATWREGYEWIWVDKVYGASRRVVKLGSRPIVMTEPLGSVIEAAIHDRYTIIRRMGADGLVASYDQISNADKLLGLLATDRSASVRLRGEYLKKKLLKAEGI